MRRRELLGLLAATSVAASGVVSLVHGVLWGLILIVAATLATYSQQVGRIGASRIARALASGSAHGGTVSARRDKEKSFGYTLSY